MGDKTKGAGAEIDIPKGIELKLEGKKLVFKGKAGSAERKLLYPGITLQLSGNKVIIKAVRVNQRSKKMIGTLKSHIKNVFIGVNQPHKYTLKICSGHFPMKVSVEGDKLIVKNFLGEKFPRIMKIKKNVLVKVEGDVIRVESCDKEIAGQTAADIETLVKRSNYDTRIFQDGCYITSKDGKDLK